MSMTRLAAKRWQMLSERVHIELSSSSNEQILGDGCRRPLIGALAGPESAVLLAAGAEQTG
ncbi:hypothetical protein EYF80_030552 [Liparis tanakae]|uniref:Uncharacterized protein n=1 Tax=Liparis tanakae TaxID=230148 RepID=A0A4Z2H073_9TELE|nr:hypothetical protein EYF80_030552 [Liparis tanakae]